jgi:predicted lipoprotein with Yx(FWY)xxD motif
VLTPTGMPLYELAEKKQSALIVRLRFPAIVLAALVLAGVTASPAMAREASAPASADAASTLTVRSSAYGRILFDSRGRALYAFTRDPRGRTACNGACAAAWPPYILRGRLRAGGPIKRSLLGTIRRSNGARQVTYAGRPLYYYVGDRRPGEVRCQNVSEFGGLWLVMRASGRIVR